MVFAPYPKWLDLSIGVLKIDEYQLIKMCINELHGFAPLGHKKSSITYIYIIKKAKFCHFYFFAVYPKIYVDKYPKTVECAFKCNKAGFSRKIGVLIRVLIYF